MRHAKKGLAAKFMIFIFIRRLARLLTRKRTCTYSGIGGGDEIRGEPAIRR